MICVHAQVGKAFLGGGASNPGQPTQAAAARGESEQPPLATIQAWRWPPRPVRGILWLIVPCTMPLANAGGRPSPPSPVAVTPAATLTGGHDVLPLSPIHMEVSSSVWQPFSVYARYIQALVYGSRASFISPAPSAKLITSSDLGLSCFQMDNKAASPEYSTPPSASNVAQAPSSVSPLAQRTEPSLSKPPAVPAEHAKHGSREMAVSPAAAGPLSQAAGSDVLHKELMAGWSPNKLASLQFFLKSEKTAAAAAPPPAVEAPRPYMGLKYLLSAGPSAVTSTAPAAGFTGAADGTAAAASYAVAANGAMPTAAAGHALPPRPSAASNRFNPYARPP